MRGAAGATRLEKYILHHWNHSPEWILNDIKKLSDFKDRKFINLQEIQDAIEVVEARGKIESHSEGFDNDYGVAHDNEHGAPRENYGDATHSSKGGSAANFFQSAR